MFVLATNMKRNWSSKYKKFIETAFRVVKRVLRPYSDKFSKRTYTQHQHAVAIMLMKYENKPYRDVVELLKEFWGYFKFGASIPHFTTLQKFFARISPNVWEFLLTKTYQLFGTTSANIAIDATGFRQRHTSFYYAWRMKDGLRQKKYRKYMKHSVSVDTDKQAIISSINVRSGPHDTRFFIPLAEKSNRIVHLMNVTADMGYDSEANHEFVRDVLGGMSIIPPRTATKFDSGTKGRYRRLMGAHFPWRKYHQRSKIETVNYVEKRKFGDELRSRLLKMQRRELKMVDVVYNIHRYINYFLSALVGFLRG